jgi:hypothetical protein
LCTLFMRPARVLRSAIVLKPSTPLHLHSLLRKRKYRMLFSPKRGCRPGPNGPKRELIDAVVEMKRRNSSWGCRSRDPCPIAQSTSPRHGTGRRLEGRSQSYAECENSLLRHSVFILPIFVAAGRAEQCRVPSTC